MISYEKLLEEQNLKLCNKLEKVEEENDSFRRQLEKQGLSDERCNHWEVIKAKLLYYSVAFLGISISGILSFLAGSVFLLLGWLFNSEYPSYCWVLYSQISFSLIFLSTYVRMRLSYAREVLEESFRFI